MLLQYYVNFFKVSHSFNKILVSIVFGLHIFSFETSYTWLNVNRKDKQIYTKWNICKTLFFEIVAARNANKWKYTFSELRRSFDTCTSIHWMKTLLYFSSYISVIWNSWYDLIQCRVFFTCNVCVHKMMRSSLCGRWNLVVFCMNFLYDTRIIISSYDFISHQRIS